MSRLVLLNLIPEKYDAPAFKRIIGAICNQVNSNSEGQLVGRYYNATVIPSATAMPAAQGDIVWASNYSVNGVTGFRSGTIGWICAAAGSPGTWQPLLIPTETSFNTTFTAGDLLYAASGSSLVGLADVAKGQVLKSGGVGAAPFYGQASLTSDVSGILPAANGGVNTQPLISYGGLNFNGTTTYLDTNALTGIADGKKFTYVVILRFANAASATEIIHSSTGPRFRIQRTAAGNIDVLAADSGGTTVLQQATTGTPCSAAGTYIVCISADLGTGQSTMQFVVNGTAAGITNTTFSNTNIDFTVAEQSVGASPTGTNFFTGDMYTEWFDPTNNMDFTNAANLRKFFDVNLVPNFLGWNGELPTGTAPVSFLGYGAGSGWAHQRGTSTSQYTQNGAIANATTALNGRYAGAGGDAIGFPSGAGGTVTQATNKTTGVTLHKSCGDITMSNVTLAAATVASFVLTSDAIAATDSLTLNHISGGTFGVYGLNARCAAGSATIDVRNNSAGNLNEAIVIRYGLVKTKNS